MRIAIWQMRPIFKLLEGCWPTLLCDVHAAPRQRSGCRLVSPPQPHWSGSRWAAHMFSRQFLAQRRGAGAGRHADLQAPTLLHATLARVVVRVTPPLSCSCHTGGLRNAISRLRCRASAYALARDGRQALSAIACAMNVVEGPVNEEAGSGRWSTRSEGDPDRALT
jgi:hypothetical protein